MSRSVGNTNNTSILNSSSNSIVVGSSNTQTINSVILNATNSVVNSTTQGFYVKPIRNAIQTNALYYDASAGEISYNTYTPLTNFIQVYNVITTSLSYDTTIAYATYAVFMVGLSRSLTNNGQYTINSYAWQNSTTGTWFIQTTGTTVTTSLIQYVSVPIGVAQLTGFSTYTTAPY